MFHLTSASYLCYTRHMKICPRCKTKKRGVNNAYCVPCNAARAKERYRADPKKACLDKGLSQAKLRAAAIVKLGGRCVSCGMTDERCLQIDHINGGGHKERVKVGSHGTRRNVLAGVGGYQLLCANCNWIKRAENKETAPRKY